MHQTCAVRSVYICMRQLPSTQLAVMLFYKKELAVIFILGKA